MQAFVFFVPGRNRPDELAVDFPFVVWYGRSTLGGDMIRYKCPKCGIRLESPESTAWQKTQCPRCGAQHIIPKSHSHSSALVTCLYLGALAVIVGVMVWLWRRGDTGTEDDLAAPPSVAQAQKQPNRPQDGGQEQERLRREQEKLRQDRERLRREQETLRREQERLRQDQEKRRREQEWAEQSAQKPWYLLVRLGGKRSAADRVVLACATPKGTTRPEDLFIMPIGNSEAYIRQAEGICKQTGIKNVHLVHCHWENGNFDFCYEGNSRGGRGGFAVCEVAQTKPHYVSLGWCATYFRASDWRTRTPDLLEVPLPESYLSRTRFGSAGFWVWIVDKHGREIARTTVKITRPKPAP